MGGFYSPLILDQVLLTNARRRLSIVPYFRRMRCGNFLSIVAAIVGTWIWLASFGAQNRLPYLSSLPWPETAKGLTPSGFPLAFIFISTIWSKAVKVQGR